MERRRRVREGDGVAGDALALHLERAHRVAEGASRGGVDEARELVADALERARAVGELAAVADDGQRFADAHAGVDEEREQPARGVDARPIDPGKRQRLRGAAGRDQDVMGDDRVEPLGAAHREQRRPVSRAGVVRVEPDDLGAPLDAPARGDDGALLLGDPRLAGKLGIKLPEHAPSQQQIALEQDHLRPRFRSRARRREPGRPGADHDQPGTRQPSLQLRRGRVGQFTQAREAARHLEHDAPEQPRLHHQVVVVESAGKEEVGGAQQILLDPDGSVLPGALHPWSKRRPAREQAGHAVDPHQALAAASGETEGPARPVVLDGAREGGDARAQERRGHRVAFLALERVAVEGERNGLGHLTPRR